ncbi:MAG: hypothetical protein M9920_01070 [Verrucomicrobiae bacterium]|nr:hypothetical protein [Verrucomicrobiae bacterium]
MKKAFAIGVLFVTGLSLVGIKTQAQGTIYISNLDRQTTGSLSVGADARLATWFRTGTAPSGYVLDSIQLAMDAPSGNPTGLRVMLWDFQRGESMADLTGLDPLSNGVFAYGTEGFMLSPSTVYWFVVTAATPLSVGAFQWEHAATGNDTIGIDNWRQGAAYQTSLDGIEWDRTAHAGNLKFAVSATVVPEPSSLALVLCGGALWLAAQGRRTESVL